MYERVWTFRLEGNKETEKILSIINNEHIDFILNKMLETPAMTKIEVQGKLVEFLGHTPIQVFVGAILGFVVGYIF